MISSRLSFDLTKIYRPDTKSGLGLVSQVLFAQMTTNFARYVRLKK